MRLCEKEAVAATGRMEQGVYFDRLWASYWAWSNLCGACVTIKDSSLIAVVSVYMALSWQSLTREQLE